MNSKFTYSGGEVFNFVGDDDVWVFINDQLAVDLGGIHPPQTQNVALDSLGLTKNKVYNFDFFYCERHTDGSSIRIDTSIIAYCAWYDYCGVCTGDGATCCNAKVNCDDGNACTNDACPPPQPGFPIDELSSKCSHTPVTCPFIDQCTNNQCSKEKNGACIQTPKQCPNREQECLKLDGCNPNTGCVYSPICNKPCQTGKCLTGGICEAKTVANCSTELGGDLCREYSCSEANGCQSTAKCGPHPTDECKIPKCDSTTGDCSYDILPPDQCNCGCEAVMNLCEMSNCVGNPTVCEPIRLPEIDDHNPCTIDYCDNSTGIITHTPVACSGCMKCNSTNGQCQETHSICQDGNLCTDNVCQIELANPLNGSCIDTKTNCKGNNICKVYSCDPEKGCQSEDLVCPDSGNCLVGYCDQTKGCQLKPRTCESPAYCIIAECDESIGCISYERRCAPDNAKCQSGVCKNGTETEDGSCSSQDFDPQPFICKTAAVVSTAVVAGVVVAGAVALAAAIFGGKKGYDYWKESRNVSMTGSNSNPLYEQSANAGTNPLYNDAGIN